MVIAFEPSVLTQKNDQGQFLTLIDNYSILIVSHIIPKHNTQ